MMRFDPLDGVLVGFKNVLRLKFLLLGIFVKDIG
jgi:hypothetical protein